MSYTSNSAPLDKIRGLVHPQRFVPLAGSLFLLVVPMPHTVSLRLIALAYLVVASVILVRRDGMPPLPLKWPLLFWAGLAVISVSWAVQPAYSLGEINNEIVYTMLAFFVFYGQTRAGAQWKMWNACLFLVAVVTSITALGLWYRGDAINATRYVYSGVGSYTTFAVTVFPLLLLALINSRAKWYARSLLWLIVPLVIAGAFATGNRAFWPAFGASMLVFFGLLTWRANTTHRRIQLLIAMLVLCAVSLVAFDYVVHRKLPLVADVRFDLWSFVWDRFLEHPWTGQGFGLRSFGYAYPEVLGINSIYWHPHNLILLYATQMGVLGVAALVVLFAAIVRELWGLYVDPDKKIMRLGAAGLAMVTAVLLKNMTDVFFYRENSLLFWSLLGMILGYAAYARRTSLNRTVGRSAIKQ